MRLAVLTSILASLLVAPASAVVTPGGTDTGLIAGAADRLRDDPVFVHPEASPAPDEQEAAELRRRAGGQALYVAVLPAAALQETGGNADLAVRRLATASGADGTYVLVAGRSLRVASNVLPRGASGAIARDAIARGRGDVGQILLHIADGVADVRSGAGGARGGSPARRDDSGGGGTGTLVLLGVVGAGLGGTMLLSRRRRRRREDAEFAEVKTQVRDDLVALGEDIRALDLDVELASPEVRADYGQAVTAYERAESTWESARHEEDLAPVGALLEEGRFAMAAAKARLEGRQPPERRPPCFFDPRHGPSTRAVHWAPPGGAPRPVPACEADALRIEAGEDPHAREVVVHGHRMPYWDAGPRWAPYAGGFFGGFGGGLLPGMLMGTMLGSALAGPAIAYGDDMFDGGVGGGDLGGGDLGGGDFGGGFDVGGGGFGGGGGDFGGGGGDF